MATVTVRFRPSSVPGKEGSLYYRVTHRRLSRQIGTGYKVYPDEWGGGRLKLPQGEDKEARSRYLRALEEQLERDTARLKALIRQLDLSGREYTARQVVDTFRKPDDASARLGSFIRRLARELKLSGRERLAETYTTSLNSFLRFRGGHDLPFADITPGLVESYETYLRRQGLVPNTTSFYLRNLRAVYHRAVSEGLTEDRHPFRHVYTGVEKTAKRAISSRVIRRIKDLPLPPDSPLEQARDLFLFSFYTRGMAFVDLSRLRKQDLQGGMLSYRRRKTGQALSIRWEKPMREIVDRHACPGSPYLLPVIDTPGNGERRRYLNALHTLNRHLKAIGRMAGCPIPLTSYCARHAWASIARSERVPLATISEAMGHTSERTTRIYLATLDTSAVDEANRRVIRTVCGKYRTGV